MPPRSSQLMELLIVAMFETELELSRHSLSEAIAKGTCCLWPQYGTAWLEDISVIAESWVDNCALGLLVSYPLICQPPRDWLA